MDRPAHQVDARTLERLRRALDRPGVVAAFAFGSRAEGRAREGSDLDVGIWVDPGLAAGERLDLALRVGAEMADDLAADLVVLNDASPLLRQRALRARVGIVDRDPRARVALESRSIVDFLDTQPLRDELARGLRNRIAEGRFGRS